MPVKASVELKYLGAPLPPFTAGKIDRSLITYQMLVGTGRFVLFLRLSEDSLPSRSPFRHNAAPFCSTLASLCMLSLHHMAEVVPSLSHSPTVPRYPKFKVVCFRRRTVSVVFL